MSLDLLPLFAAESVSARVVRDRNRITGAGVTAGIDFALALALEMFGDTTAPAIQLAVEYQPVPPFHSGTSDLAPRAVRDRVLRASRDVLAERRLIVARAAARLHRTDQPQ